MWVIRVPIKPYIFWIKIILAIFVAKIRPHKTIFSALTNLTTYFDSSKELSKRKQNLQCLLCLVSCLFCLLAMYATGAPPRPFYMFENWFRRCATATQGSIGIPLVVASLSFEAACVCCLAWLVVHLTTCSTSGAWGLYSKWYQEFWLDKSGVLETLCQFQPVSFSLQCFVSCFYTHFDSRAIPNSPNISECCPFSCWVWDWV